MSQSSKIIFCILFLTGHWVTSSTSRAQRDYARFENFSVEQGLSQNSGITLLQDTHGFLWIGTQGGLNRYDGYGFRHFEHIRGDSTSLADDYIRVLFEDESNTLWVGTKSGGVHRFDAETQSFQRFDLIEMLDFEVVEEVNPNDVAKIVEAAPMKLWLATAAGLVFLDALENTATIVEYGVPEVSRANELVADSEGNLWLGDEEGYVVRRSGSPESVNERADAEIMLESNASINAMHSDPGGDVWIGTTGEGLFRYDASGNTFYTGTPVQPARIDLPSDSITVIHTDRKGRLWIGYMDAGLSVIHNQDDIKHYVYDPADSYSLSGNFVLDIFIDRTGVIWIGTWDGLSRLSPHFEAFDLYIHSEERGGLNAVRVVSFEEETRDRYWIGTWGGGLMYFDESSNEFTQITAGKGPYDLCGNIIFDLDLDRNRNLWIATLDDGLCRLELNNKPSDPSRLRFTSYRHRAGDPFSLADDQLQSVLASSSGSVWVGLYNQGLSVLDGETGQFNHFSDAPEKGGLSSKQIWPIIEDHAGNIWVGAFEGGLHKYDRKTKQFEHFNLDEENPNGNRIYDLYQDSRRNLWVATDDGVKKVDPSTMQVVTYHTQDGLTHDNVRGLVEDEFGYIWISTNDGLSRFSPEDSTFKNFYLLDGLQGNRFYARSAMRATNGKLFFGGSNGFNIVDPSLIHADTVHPKIVLKEILVQNEPYSKPGTPPPYLLENLELEHDENRFTLSFAALNFTNVNQNRYRYRLTRTGNNWDIFRSIPTDTSWADHGGDNTVTMALQGYGDYLFEVMGANSDGIWSEPWLRLPVNIKTPWWAQAWFRLLVLLAMGGLVVGAILIRTNYLLGLERLRVKIAGGLHDDVGPNLATIAMNLGMMKSRLDITDNDRKKLNDLSVMARETGQIIRETGWIINARYDNLNRLVTQMQDLAHMMLDGTLTHTFKHYPDHIPERRIGMEFKQNVYLLYKEALNNANKHAQASHIHVEFAYDNNSITLRIQDDGVGYSRNAIKEGSGLTNMERRAEEINGEVALESEAGKGTVITLKAPLG